jgi:hypothetical protein
MTPHTSVFSVLFVTRKCSCKCAADGLTRCIFPQRGASVLQVWRVLLLLGVCTGHLSSTLLPWSDTLLRILQPGASVMQVWRVPQVLAVCTGHLSSTLWPWSDTLLHTLQPGASCVMLQVWRVPQVLAVCTGHPSSTLLLWRRTGLCQTRSAGSCWKHSGVHSAGTLRSVMLLARIFHFVMLLWQVAALYHVAGSMDCLQMRHQHAYLL